MLTRDATVWQVDDDVFLRLDRLPAAISQWARRESGTGIPDFHRLSHWILGDLGRRHDSGLGASVEYHSQNISIVMVTGRFVVDESGSMSACSLEADTSAIPLASRRLA